MLHIWTLWPMSLLPTRLQATAALTSKHFAQRRSWWRCAAGTHRSTAAASSSSWTPPPLSCARATSAKPWGQSFQPRSGPWCRRAGPCPPSSGPCWPTPSLWCWKLYSESSPTLSVLTGTTHMVRILFGFLLKVSLPCNLWLLGLIYVFH